MPDTVLYGFGRCRRMHRVYPSRASRSVNPPAVNARPSKVARGRVAGSSNRSSHRWRAGVGSLVLPLVLLGWILVRGGGGQELLEEEFPVDMAAERPLDSYPAIAPHRVVIEPDSASEQPVLIPRGDDRVLLACLSTELGVGDRILAATMGPEEEGEFVAVTPTPAEMVFPSGARDAEGRPQLFWGQLVGGVCRLHTSVLEGDGWTSPRELATGPGPSFRQRAVRTRDGRLLLTWQEYRKDTGPVAAGDSVDDAVEPNAGAGESASSAGGHGRFEVFVAEVRGTELVGTRQISEGPFSSSSPAICEDAEGTVHVAYVSYGGRDYEVLVRTLGPDGSLSDPVNVSMDPSSDDIHPSLAADRERGVWVAFDSIRDAERGRSGPDPKSLSAQPPRNAVRLAHVRAGRVYFADHEGEPAMQREGLVVQASPLSQTGGLPQLAVDRSGRLQLAFRRLHHDEERPRYYGYPVFSQSLLADGWSETSHVTGSVGADQETVICASESGCWLAWQQDQRMAKSPIESSGTEIPAELARGLESRGIFLTRFIAASGIGLAFLPASSEAAAPVELIPRVEQELEPRDHPLVEPTTSGVITGRAHHEIRYEDRVYRVYWGDLHRHSSVSRCSAGFEPRPEDRYMFGRDVCLYDFYALTDHGGQTDPYQWWRMSKLVDLYQNPDFVTLQGFEWSSSTDGHSNVIFRERTQEIVAYSHGRGRDITKVWETLARGAAITIPHHTAAGENGTAWGVYDPRFLRQVEVFQARRGSYEFGGCYLQARSAWVDDQFVQAGLDRGLQFGLIASTDHGNRACYAAVLAEDLTRDEIFLGLHRRRTYASTTKGILMDFRIDGRLMGRTLEAEGPVEVEVEVRGTRELAEVVVFRNGELWKIVGRGPRDPDAVGELILMVSRDPAGEPLTEDERVRLDVSEGRFLSARRSALRQGTGPFAKPGWSKLARDSAMYFEPASFGGRRIAANQRVRLKAADRETLTFAVGDRKTAMTVGELRASRAPFTVEGTPWKLGAYGQMDALVDTERGMGTAEFRETWTDDDVPEGNSWYYARAIQVDGEVVWSSPIFVEN